MTLYNWFIGISKRLVIYPIEELHIMSTKNVTLEEVGRHAGVGKMTVSMVLRGKPIRCKQETRDRVLEAAKKLNYQPNLAAKALYNKKSDIIGLFTPRLGMEVNMVETECCAAGFRLTASSFHNDSNILSDLLQDMRQRYAAGVIIFDPPKNCEAIHKWRNDGLPIVLLAGAPDIYPEIDTYVTNTAGAVEEIVKYFIEAGHTKIGGIFTSVDLLSNSMAFWQGWENGLETIGLKPDPDSYFPMMYRLEDPETKIYDSAYNATLNFIKRFDKDDPARPTAIFTMGDIVAVPVVKAFEENGWSVPGDISIASNYISELGRYLPIPLTGILEDRITLRAGAAKCLLNRINNKKKKLSAPIKVYSHQELVIRHSTTSI